MKCAIVFDGLRFGGIEKVGIDYIRLFNEIGYDVTVFNLNPSLVDMENEINTTCEIVHIKYPRWLAPERYSATLKNTCWGRFVYPVAFVGMSAINFIYRILLSAKKEIRTQYDISIAFAGHINDLTFVGDNFIKADKKIAWLHGAMYGYSIISPGFMRLYSKIKNLVSLSNMCDAEFYKFIQKNQINKCKLYNPITIKLREVDYEFVKQLKNQYGDFCLMVARMDVDKDQRTAIDAIGLLSEKYKLNKKLVLVGDGKTRTELEDYVHKKMLEGQVIFAGKTADVQNYYEAASVYVHSSPLEGLPTVLLEAMYYQLPIASTDSIPGVREILGNQECGLISEVYDSESLADNIYRLYTDKNLAEKLVKKGAERLDDFAPDVIKKQLVDFLDGLDEHV